MQVHALGRIGRGVQLLHPSGEKVTELFGVHCGFSFDAPHCEFEQFAAQYSQWSAVRLDQTKALCLPNGRGFHAEKLRGFHRYVDGAGNYNARCICGLVTSILVRLHGFARNQYRTV